MHFVKSHIIIYVISFSHSYHQLTRTVICRMDSKKVSALLTAIDRGSLTAAAAELGYTQSGLTHMMNSLEDELGVSLLIRSKGGVRLSPTGPARA